jgi:hypothetical protein
MKYTGSLSKTIVGKRIAPLSGADAFTVEYKRQDGEMLAKLPDLFRAHEVTVGDWLGLALALAKAHVPGFKVVRRAGPRTKWDVITKAEFRLDVDTEREKSGLSVVKAIEHVWNLEFWRVAAIPTPLSALQKHYYSADLEIVEVLKEARAWHALPPTALKLYE